MRDAFVAELSHLAEQDPSVMLVTGDLGFGVLTEFACRFPNQYLNAGVAEQNMAGIAAGLAIEGRRVFTYSIANFPTLRCVEQLRNDVCYHRLSVTVVAVGGGFAYGPLGFSHHATEDVAIMSALPGMRVMAPNDPIEARACTRLCASFDGPTYLRLGRNGERRIHSESLAIVQEGKLIHVAGSSDAPVALVAGCGALDIAAETADLLRRSAIGVSLWACPFIVPFDHDGVRRLASDADLLVTVEEHALIGGLGTRCAHAIAALTGRRARHLGFGIPPEPQHAVGDQRYLRSRVGLTADRISETVSAAISATNR
jgi:transketolase